MITRTLQPLRCEYCAKWSLCQFSYTETDCEQHYFCSHMCLTQWVLKQDKTEQDGIGQDRCQT